MQWKSLASDDEYEKVAYYLIKLRRDGMTSYDLEAEISGWNFFLINQNHF